MNIWSKRTMLAVLSSAVLLSGAAPAVYAADAGTQEAAAAALPAAYKLTGALQAEVKSIAAERTAAGVRVGAVVRLTNMAQTNARVPEYELQIKTKDGVTYTLEPSAVNSRFVRPQSEAELSYLVDIDGLTSIDVTHLEWVDVDYYTYPKTETVKLAVPVGGRVWQGVGAASGSAVQSGWGQPFQIKELDTSLVYTPVAVNEQASSAGMTKVIKLLVKNTGAAKATVPMLTIEGNDGTDSFAGNRAETGEIVLQPNETTYVHLVLPMKPNSEFASVTIGTAESFTSAASGAPQTTQYFVGRVNVQLPAISTPVIMVPSYKLGDAVDLSKVSDNIPKEVRVSLVEMSMFEPQGSGYKTIVAKFNVENQGTKAMPIPGLLAELVSGDGGQYVGARQSNAPSQVLPGLATVVSYVFSVPSTETGENVILKMQEPVVSAAGTVVRSDLVGVKLDVQQPDTERTFSFYPYTVTVNSKTLSTMFSPATLGYTYKLKMDLDIAKAEKVVTDRDFSLMEIEMVDYFGRTLGSTELSFVSNLPNGNLQLVSGSTVAYFTDLRTEQASANLTLRIYEKIQTDSGTVRRLVTTLQ